MLKADLHCHSIYSEHPAEWFLQKLGARESYTDPFYIYDRAIKKGMDMVCITDHNKIDGALLLKEKHPSQVIVGVESTAYFPEDGCKIHILIYDLNEKQFETINLIRKDIYELRAYLLETGLTHSVAHASYSVNGKLKRQHLEKLILMFDIFESVNGGRNVLSNLGWKHILDNLDENLIATLYQKHRIQPASDAPWIKGYTGGSDDHAGIFVGSTYTQAQAANQAEFLRAIRAKQSTGIGRHNDFHSLAFTIYKVAYDFSKQQSGKKKENPLLSSVTEALFENRGLDLGNKLRIRTIKGLADIRGDELKKNLAALLDTLNNSRDLDVKDKLDKVYLHISDLADSYFKILLDSIEGDLLELNLIKLIRNFSMSIPGVFLILPFFSSIKHMNSSVELLANFRKEHQIPEQAKSRRTLWFSDTINDLNGVSVTLKEMGYKAISRGRNLKIVASMRESEIGPEIPPNLVNLPHMYSFRLPYYESYLIKVPSVLKSVKLIAESEPDQIIISTPGPVGLLGLLMAKLLNVHCIGIYHTDFHAEASHIIDDESFCDIILSYERWFYSQMDEIRVPTREYGMILEDRNIHAKEVKLLRRGIDANEFEPLDDRKQYLKTRLGSEDGFTLLYAGRVSKDKSLDLLCEVYRRLIEIRDDFNLIVAGNGPYLSEMKEELKDYPRAHFTGALSRDKLPEIYNAADVFLFPSVTDTFGMVILESLACGLPALVSNHGGPKELVSKGGGAVVPDQKPETWIKAILEMVELAAKCPESYEQLRAEARERVKENSDWDVILDDLLGKDSVLLDG
ncbi:MAG TPA: glycosyltransferase [Candidatus Cloacimonadota bacterium]|nr:glycosyltransferase [Candidatus Cloacimonadota bacterium]